MTTIFAPITSVGAGGVTIIRISGEKTAECMRVLGITELPKVREATLRKITNPMDKSVLDEPMVLYFKAPKSFTGEDVCELNLHSSQYIVTKVMEILGNIDDVRLAEPGEFSKRAFLNNKIDLTQAEAICDLINSQTEDQQKQAMAQLQGYMRDFYASLRSELLDIISNVEAYIDFPEEELPSDLVDELQNRINSLKKKISKHLDDGKVGEKIREGIFITILGSPNVGKSTLLNYLAKRDVAIVSNIQGTTRDIIEVDLNLNGVPVVLFDTAGIRETEDIVEQEGVKRAVQKAKDADLKIVLFEPENLHKYSEISNLIDKNTIIVINKSDLIDTKIRRSIAEFKEKFGSECIAIIEISLKDNTGVSDLIKTLSNETQKIIRHTSPIVITRERHRKALQNAYKLLQDFSLNKDIELIAEDLRIVSSAIGKITGEIGVENILDNIFSKFCLGK